MEGFQDQKILYPTYIGRWVHTPFILLERLCCNIIIGFIVTITGLLLKAGFDICSKKRGYDEEKGIVWGAGTGVFNLPSSLGLPTDSIITYPDKYGVFLSFFDMTHFLASYFPSPSSDTFYLASYPSYPPSELSLSYYLPNYLNFNATDSLYLLAFAFVLYGIEPTHCCISYYSSSFYLVATFLDQHVWHDCLSEKGAFTQNDAIRIILYV